MSGNVPGGNVVKERPLGAAGASQSGFVQHLITTGLETLFEGVTVATIHQDRNFHRQQMKPLVYGSDMITVNGRQQPNLVAAVYEQVAGACLAGLFVKLGLCSKQKLWWRTSHALLTNV